MFVVGYHKQIALFCNRTVYA